MFEDGNLIVFIENCTKKFGQIFFFSFPKEPDRVQPSGEDDDVIIFFLFFGCLCILGMIMHMLELLSIC